MRRIVSVILAFCLILFVSGCGPSIPSVNDLINQANQDNASGSDDPKARLEALNKAFDRDKTNRDALSNLIAFHKDRGDYKACVDVYEEYLSDAYNDLDSLIDLAYCQMKLGDYDKARTACEKAIELNTFSAEAYNTLGNVYADLTEYQKAIEAYRKASSLDESYQPSRTNTLWALFYSSQYDECLNEAEEQIKLGYETYDLYYYIGGSYEAQNKLKEAEQAYKKALEFEFGDYSDAYYHLGLLAFNDEDYTNARNYIGNALLQNPQNKDALWLSGELENLDQPLNERLSDFIGDEYLYQNSCENFDQNVKRLEDASNAAQNELVKLAEQSLHPQDPFSFFITGKEYEDYLIEQESPTVSHSTKTISGEDCEIFRIYYFTPMTGKEFANYAKKIQNPQNKVLLFDLRANGGGDMKACSEILDYLLGDCVTVSFIDRNGYSSSFYSSADRVAFKKIVILTDNNTASASELLTLGLKVYLPDTLIIGDHTFGKGVSQNVFNDPKNKLAFWMVNTYWNVREINIDGYGIEPDTLAKTQSEIDSALQNALSMVQ